MAQIETQTFLVTLNKLVKTPTGEALAPAGTESELEAIVTALVGDESIIVEVTELGDDA